ncbi:MAG: tetratricopeptide repeat protein, partial [Deltaproteobacteria bacterium]|nr:tetratricopeptide repeat protein [Deltaproteobacteria bacterium]
ALVATSAAVAFLVRNPDIGPEPPPRCDAIADAALAPIWNPDRRAALTAALATDGADRAAHLVAQVDAYAAGWRGVREAACRSARLDHTWPTELEASATRCLDARGTALDRTVGALTTDPATRDAATDAISGLSGFRTCGDPDYLRSAVEVAIAPALRPRVTALMDRIEAAVLDVSLGRQAAVAAAIPALRAEAASLQHGPALAHLDILEGDMARAAGDLRLAIARHLAAYTAARAARDPVQATGAAIALIWDHGLLGEDTARATDWAAVAQAEVATLGDRGLAMSVAYAEGALADRRGDLAQATAHFERAVALATAEFGPDHFATAKVQGALASVLGAAGRFDEAIGPHRQAIATLERWEGPDGASLVRMLGNLALTEDSANQHAAAAADARRALAIAERDGDPERLGTAAHNLGVVLGNAGDHAAASLLFRRAEGTFRDAGLPGAAAGSVIARLLPGPDAGADARARREARAALTAARTAVVVAYGPDAPEVADADRALAAWAR